MQDTSKLIHFIKCLNQTTPPLRNTKQRQNVTQKLKEFFKKYLTTKTIIQDPTELANASPIMDKLKNITIEGLENRPPDAVELITVIKKLKDGKSSNDVPTTYVKHATDSRESKDEIFKLCYLRNTHTSKRLGTFKTHNYMERSIQ